MINHEFGPHAEVTYRCYQCAAHTVAPPTQVQIGDDKPLEFCSLWCATIYAIANGLGKSKHWELRRAGIHTIHNEPRRSI